MSKIKYIVRVFNDALDPRRYYEQYFLTKEEQSCYYHNIIKIFDAKMEEE